MIAGTFLTQVDMLACLHTERTVVTPLLRASAFSVSVAPSELRRAIISCACESIAACLAYETWAARGERPLFGAATTSYPVFLSWITRMGD